MKYKVFKINLLTAESTYDIPEGWNPGKILYSSEEIIIMMIEKYPTVSEQQTPSDYYSGTLQLDTRLGRAITAGSY